MRWTEEFLELDKACHDRTSFDCGVPELTNFLKNHAARHMRAGISKTMVLPASDPLPNEKKPICAFYTITPSVIAVNTLPKKRAKALPRHPIPVFLIAQLAIHLDVQSQGLGKATLIKALEHLWNISKHMPAYAVVVDCLSDNLEAFYRQFGFEWLCKNEGKTRLFLPMKTVARLFESP